MAYNNMISRSDAEALIPEDAANDILEVVPVMNPILSMARKLPNLTRAQRRLPVLGTFATASFLSGDNARKQTTEVNWENKYIDAEEIAAIVPIPESVLDDSSYDIWGQVKPELQRAISVAITKALIYGTNIPASWTTNLGAAGLVALTTAASHYIDKSGYDDLYDAILGETAAGVSGLFGLVEEDGYMVTGSIAHLTMKRKLRAVRDADGQPIFTRSMQDRTRYELDGQPLAFPSDGTITAATSLLIAGQFDQLVYAMRQDMTYKILDQAVIQDATGAIIYNLAQQDMVALRAVVRIGVALPNPPSRENENDTTRCPFAILY